jgi:hypothetical protein
MLDPNVVSGEKAFYTSILGIFFVNRPDHMGHSLLERGGFG